jgi:8-oxo-dGTP pyrophosphatase MutT (NUDIX family)
MIREAHEEVGVLIDPADLAFSHVVHHATPKASRAPDSSSPPPNGLN